MGDVSLPTHSLNTNWDVQGTSENEREHAIKGAVERAELSENLFFCLFSKKEDKPHADSIACEYGHKLHGDRETMG